MRNPILSIILMLFLPQLALASTGFKHDSSTPIEVTADELEVHQNKEIAIFTGNVEAVQGELIIKSDEMVVHYRQAEEEEQNAISKIEAKGDVFVVSKEETAQGAYGLFQVDQDRITLIKQVVVTSGDHIVKGDKLVYDLKTGQSKMMTKPEEGKKSGRVRGVFVPKKGD